MHDLRVYTGFDGRGGEGLELKEEDSLQKRGSLPIFLYGTIRVSYIAESVLLNVYGAQESIPRNEFRQPM
jgi:hypothetical protein